MQLWIYLILSISPMLKIYQSLVRHIEHAELRLETKIKAQLNAKGRGWAILQLLLLNSKLFLLELFKNCIRFLIVLFIDSGQGFKAVFQEHSPNICTVSYGGYKQVQKKLRTLSFGTFSVLILATAIVSLVMNLLFGGKLPGWAATFSWQQSSWTLGASSTAVANHTANQTNWTRFSSSTSNIATTTGGAITLTASSVVAKRYDVDADFNAYTKSTNIYVTGGSLKLTKPFGASCAADSECTDGAGFSGWCNANVCTNPWLSGPCGTTNLVVYKSDVAGTQQWKTTDGSCAGPQCSGGVLVADNAVDFSAYPARNACKAIGARLPTLAELACIYTNKATYNNNFQSYNYWSATEYPAASAWVVNFSSGGQTGYGKTYSLYVRCVKGQ